MKLSLFFLALTCLVAEVVALRSRSRPQSVARMKSRIQGLPSITRGCGSGGARGPPGGGPLFSTSEDGEESDKNGNEAALSETEDSEGEDNGWAE